MRPKHSLAGDGVRFRANGDAEAVDEAQMFFYADGHVSGSFVCKTPESTGILWLFSDGSIIGHTLRFSMVHIELRYPRDPVAQFVGEYDGEGTYAGTWHSQSETGRWQLTLRDIVRPHDLSENWKS